MSTSFNTSFGDDLRSHCQQNKTMDGLFLSLCAHRQTWSEMDAELYSDQCILFIASHYGPSEAGSPCGADHQRERSTPLAVTQSNWTNRYVRWGRQL
jgi:hypothetical protein